MFDIKNLYTTHRLKQARIISKPRERETYLGFGRQYAHGPYTLSSSGDLREAAARLYDMLRTLDEISEAIAIAPIPEEGLGEAINDRLRRASL